MPPCSYACLFCFFLLLLRFHERLRSKFTAAVDASYHVATSEGTRCQTRAEVRRTASQHFFNIVTTGGFTPGGENPPAIEGPSNVFHLQNVEVAEE